MRLIPGTYKAAHCEGAYGVVSHIFAESDRRERDMAYGYFFTHEGARPVACTWSIDGMSLSGRSRNLSLAT